MSQPSPSRLSLLRVLAAAAGVLLLLVAVAVAVAESRERSRDELDRALVGESRAHVQSLEGYFERARAISLVNARNPAIRRLYERREPGAHGPSAGLALRDATRSLAYLERLYPGSIGEACLIDSTGHEQARVVRGKVAPDHDLSHEESGAPFFEPAFAAGPGRVVQVRPYLSPDTNEWVVSNATRIPWATGPSPAIVHFEVTIESFRREARSNDDRFFTRVVDPETRTVVFDSRVAQRSGGRLGRPASAALVAAARSAGTQAGQEVDGRRSVMRRVRQGADNANRWVVVVSARGAAATGFSLSATACALLVVALVFLAAAFVAFRHSSRALRRAALTDALTGLPNRTLLQDRLQQAVLMARRAETLVGVMILDLDRFKEINDTLGHHEGDVLLREVARRIDGAVRGYDTVARLGGDEFAVLLPGLEDPAAAVRVAERIADALRAPVELGGVDVDVSASCGIALHPHHGHDVERLLQCADIAMYEAKRTRRNHAIYSAELDPHTADRLSLVSALRQAIEGDAIDVHYQPKFGVASGELCGVEALVRWNHPERGPVSPADFVPVAEQTGLIRPLASRVLDAAIGQVRAWLDEGCRVPVAVNLSVRNLLDHELPEEIAALLERHGVPSELLELEITESVVMEDPERALATLSRLSSMGIRLAIDDFGTGYSSLAYLKRLPVSELKIDRCFVAGMAEDASDESIVRSTIDLGHHLGLRVVAEGVEDAATLERLNAMGCDTAQGYHLGRPGPAAGLAGTVLTARVPG